MVDNMTPSQITKKLKKLEADYIKQKELLARTVFEKRIVPYCQKHKLSFVMMNGIPRFTNANDEYVSLPKFMDSIIEISDSEGDCLMWYFDSYKHNPTVDFNSADHKFWLSKNDTRPLGAIIFGLDFSM